MTGKDDPGADIDNKDTTLELSSEKKVGVTEGGGDDAPNLAAVDDLGVLPPIIVERGEALAIEGESVSELIPPDDPGIIPLTVGEVGEREDDGGPPE